MRLIRTFLGERLSERVTEEEYQKRYHKVRGTDKTPCECCGKNVSVIIKEQHLKTASCHKHLMTAVDRVIEAMSIGENT